MKALFFTLTLLLTWNVTAATCEGTWITVDDETGKQKSKVKLYKYKGEMYGKITYLYPNDKLSPDRKCTKCEDNRKNEPLVGLQIVRNMTWDGAEWEGGTICDPKTGKIYTCKLWLDPENYDKLKVRGYSWGLYRTQTWTRTTDD